MRMGKSCLSAYLIHPFAMSVCLSVCLPYLFVCLTVSLICQSVCFRYLSICFTQVLLCPFRHLQSQHFRQHSLFYFPRVPAPASHTSECFPTE